MTFCNIYVSCQRTEEEKAQTLQLSLKESWRTKEQLMAWQNTAFGTVTKILSFDGEDFFSSSCLFPYFFLFLKEAMSC